MPKARKKKYSLDPHNHCDAVVTASGRVAGRVCKVRDGYIFKVVPGSGEYKGPVRTKNQAIARVLSGKRRR